LNDGAYARQWRDLRRRDVLCLAAFALYLPGAVVLFLALGAIAHDWTIRYESWLGLGWFGIFAAALIYHGRFRCPNCGKPFFSNDRWRNAFSSKCLNCGIRRGAGPQPKQSDLRRRP
jgi:hypothetical protein